MVERNGEYHIGAYAPVNIVTINVIVQITVLVNEYLGERLASKRDKARQRALNLLIACKHSHLLNELESVVPQRVDLNNITCTWNYRTAVCDRVHPCHSLVTAICCQQTVRCNTQVTVSVVADIVIDEHQEIAILVTTSFQTALLGILLDCPYSPKEDIGVLHLIYLALACLVTDEILDCNACCLHNLLVLLYVTL